MSGMNNSATSLLEDRAFRAFFELSAAGAEMVDAETLRFVRVNRRLCEMTGYTEDELLERTFLDITVAEDRDREIDNYRSQCGTSNQWSIEKRYVTKTGGIVWANVTGTAVCDDDGKPLYSLATVTDITERKRTNRLLEESEAKFRTLSNSIPQLAFMTNGAGRFTWFNEQWLGYTGTSLERMIGFGWNEFLHPDHAERVMKLWLDCVATGTTWEDTFPLRGKDRSYRWFLSRATLTRDESGAPLRWVGTNTDITDHLETERELERHRERLELALQEANAANELKTSFLANVSHEIRTPLGAILGFSELLRMGGYDDREKQSFHDVIQRNGDQLSALINDILELATVESERVSVDIRPTSIANLVAEVRAELSGAAAPKNLELAFTGAADLAATVRTDPHRLKQILFNLVGNAIKFTNVGRVSVDVRRVDRDVLFTVTDTGIGISPSQVSTLFRPFSQADPSITRRFGGTGLGLVLAKRFAGALGGDLILRRSQVGEGTTFEVRIRDFTESQ